VPTALVAIFRRGGYNVQQSHDSNVGPQTEKIWDTRSPAAVATTREPATEPATTTAAANAIPAKTSVPITARTGGTRLGGQRLQWRRVSRATGEHRGEQAAHNRHAKRAGQFAGGVVDGRPDACLILNTPMR
jgi:hypothetical protein